MTGCVLSGGCGTLRFCTCGVSPPATGLFSRRVSTAGVAGAFSISLFTGGRGTTRPGVLARGCETSAGLTAGLATAGISGAFELAGCLASCSSCIFAGCFWIRILSSFSTLASTGLPGWLANSCSLAANGTGLGGAGSFSTTFLDSRPAGGAAAVAPAFAPNTLLREGATGGAATNAVSFNSLAGTCTAALSTGWEFASAVLGTAVTAPGTFWFA